MKKVSLTKEDVLHLARLANITVAEKEVEKLDNQLSETITYVENLHELDTEQIKEATSPINIDNVYFEDGSENKRQLTQQQALQNSQTIKDNYFKVKKVM